MSSPLARRTLLVMIPAAFLLMGAVAVVHHVDGEHQRAILAAEGTHVVSLGHAFMSREFSSVQADLIYLSRQDGLQELLAGDESRRSQLEGALVHFGESKRVYDHMRLLDMSGREIIRVDLGGRSATAVPATDLPDSPWSEFPTGVSLRPGQILVSPFDLDAGHGRIERPLKPVVRFLSEVVDPEGRPCGVMAISYLGSFLLEKLRENSLRFRGRSMLLNQRGDYLLAESPELEWGWLLGHPRSFRTDEPVAWEEICSLQQGQFWIGDDLFTVQDLDPAGSAGSIAAEGSGARMLLVSHIPARVVTERSDQLLGQLVAICAATLIVVLVLALQWARSATVREAQEQQLIASEMRLRTLSGNLLAAQEAERTSLSRWLHDELGQLTTATILDLRSAAREPLGDRAAGFVGQAISQAEQLLASLHEISTRLRPAVLDDLGLDEAIVSLITEFEARHACKVRRDVELAGEDSTIVIAPTVGENVYRILQQALTNVAAHSGATEAVVLVRVEGRELRMMIQDFGRGFDVSELEDTSRLGVLGMRERVELLSGRFEISSAPGEGTTIRAWIPL